MNLINSLRSIFSVFLVSMCTASTVKNRRFHKSQVYFNQRFAADERERTNNSVAKLTENSASGNSSTIFSVDSSINHFKQKISLYKRGENLSNKTEENNPNLTLSQYKIKLKKYITKIGEKHQACIANDHSHSSIHKDLIYMIRIIYMGLYNNFFDYFKHIPKENELYISIPKLVDRKDLTSYKFSDVNEFLEILKIFTALLVEYMRFVTASADGHETVQILLDEISSNFYEFYYILGNEYRDNQFLAK